MDIPENRPLTKQFISFSRVSSLVVAAIGIFALTGWIFDIQVFKSVLPGFTTIKTNTAIAFILAGIAMWFASRERLEPAFFRLKQICSGGAFLIGLFTLAEYTFGWDLRIDQLIFRDFQTQQASFPGRMAFASALCFALAGMALISINRRTGKAVDLAQYLAVASLSISMIALVGYVYDVQALYKLGPSSSMALPSAAGFTICALGILCAQPDRGVDEAHFNGHSRGRRPEAFASFFVLGIPIFIGWLVVLGDRVGLYETHFGLAMLSVITAGILTITLWLISRQLKRIDAERKQAQETLLQSEQKFSILFEKAAFAASLSKLPDGVMVDINEAFEKSFEYTKQEAIGRTSLELGINPDAEDRARILAALREDGSVRNQEIALHTKSGKVSIFSVNVDLIEIGDQKYILNTTQDITERKQAQEELQKLNNQLEQHVAERTAELSSSEVRFRGLFEHTPVSIWEEDFSAVRQYIDELQRTGIVNLSAYFDDHPEEISACAALVKVVDVNHATIEMYQAQNKAQLLTNLSQVLGPESLSMFKLELLSLTGGATSYENETINYTLNGEKRIVFVRLTVAPGHEQTWAKVFVGINDITEQRQAEAALAAERDLLQALMDNVPDTIYFKDAASRFTRINRAQASVLGVEDPGDAIGKKDFDYFQSSELAQGFYEEEQKIIETGEPLINRIEFNPTRDGQPRWFSATKVPTYDENGHITGIVGISRDITGRIQAEEAQRESESKLRAIFDTMSEGIALNEMIYNEKGEMIDYRILEVNQAFYSTADYIGDQVVGNVATKLYGLSPEDIKVFWETHKVRSEVQHIEYYSPLKNRSFFISTSPFVNDRFVTSFFDITERKQIENALQEAEIKYRTLVEHLPAIVYLDQYDPSVPTGYRPVYMSPQVETILGYSADEFLKDPNLWPSLHYPDDHERALAADARHYEAGESLHQEYRVIARDGHIVWLRDEAVMIQDEAEGRRYSQGVLLDVTERKQAEEALLQSEERFRLMAWATKDAVWDWDLRTNQIWWGTGLQKIFHYSSEITQTDDEWWLSHIHMEDRDKVSRSMNQALEGGLEFWSKEYRFQRVDETYANIMDRGYILRDNTGKPYRIIGAMMDITEQKQAERALWDANEKMAGSLSELELRNYEIVLLNEMSDLLQASLSEREAHAIIADAAKNLFPGTAGGLYLFNAERTLVNAAGSWGDPPPAAQTFAPNDCWALRRGQTHQLYADESKPRCAHISEPIPALSYCLPMVAQGEVLGMLHLQASSKENLTEPKHQLAYTVVEQSAMALSNLKLREALREQSIRDPLTGLYNRRYMEEVLKQHLRRATRHIHPLGMIMIDIDHFKAFNDTYGHTAGDTLLRQLGRFLQTHIRGEDVACRYGGEEFILIMPDASSETARQRAEHLRQEVKGIHAYDAGQLLGGITLSLGVAIYPQHGHNIETVIRAADAALYRAKQEGRDRVVVAEKAD